MTTYADPPRSRPRPRPRGGEPVLPPKPPKRRDPLWAKISIIAGAVVMVISGLVVVVPKVASAWFLGDVKQVDAIPEELRGTDISGPINFLLLGMDQRNGADAEDRIRADSIILVHIPAAHDRAFMISIPRDSEVVIPPYPTTGYRGGTDKINAAFAAAAVTRNGDRDPSPEGRGRGLALTMSTISNLVPGGLKFNGAAVIDFEGFKDVLEALGGVNMCVDVDTYSIHFLAHGEPLPYDLEDDQAKKLGKHYPIGCYDMVPWEALDYARQRHLMPNGDYDRQRHQQQLIKAIVKKAMSGDTVTDFKKIGALQNAAGKLLTLDLGRGNELADWVLTLAGLRSEDIVMIKTNGGTFSSNGNGSNERLIPETLTLLKAVQTDTVFDFLTAHPDWVAGDK